MNRILIIAVLAAVAALAISCSQTKTPKVLVLYYSQNGTTKALAEELCNKLGADIEAITPAVPYDGDFQATIERSRKEMDENTLPEIQPLKSKLKNYDTIFLGYPIWFGTYAPPIATLLETVDLTGKIIVPFCSFGSGGLYSSIKDLKEKLPNSEVLPGYGVRTARIGSAPAEIDRFLKEGGFIEGEVEKLADISETRPVTEEESAIFDAAIGGYPMMNAKAAEVASRPIPNGTEYLFTANDLPREGGMQAPPGGPIKVYVVVEEGKDPEFTQVLR